jgi:hypothetical protein
VRQASEYLTRVDNPRLEKPYERLKLGRLVRELVAAVRNTSGRSAHN